jgi:plasmid stabilization system protein ParE
MTEDTPHEYVIVQSESVEADVDTLMLFLLRRSPEGAGVWLSNLNAAVESLSTFPHRCPLAPQGFVSARNARQLLFRYGSATYRILFTITEGQSGEPSTVRILRLFHGLQQPRATDEAEQ